MNHSLLMMFSQSLRRKTLRFEKIPSWTRVLVLQRQAVPWLLTIELCSFSWARSISSSSSQTGSHGKLGQGQPTAQSPTVTHGQVRMHCKWDAVHASRHSLSKTGDRHGSRQLWRSSLQLSSQAFPASNDISEHLKCGWVQTSVVEKLTFGWTQQFGKSQPPSKMTKI